MNGRFAGEWHVSDDWYCRAHRKLHVVRVVYVRNPMDVNILAYYMDGKRDSYRYL
jgi:hypothetical protein